MSEATEIRDIARALNGVRTVGQAWAAAQEADRAAQAFLSRAASLPGSFLAGAYNKTTVTKTLTAALSTLRAAAKEFNAPSRFSAPVGAGWTKLRNAITRIYVEGSPIAAVEDNKPLASMAADLARAVEAYGEKLTKAGISAPGVVIGDIVGAVGKIGGAAAKGVGEGAGDLLAGARAGIGSILWSLAPVLIVVGVAVYYLPQIAGQVGKARGSL